MLKGPAANNHQLAIFTEAGPAFLVHPESTCLCLPHHIPTCSCNNSLPLWRKLDSCTGLKSWSHYSLCPLISLVSVLCLVAQLCPTLGDPMDYSVPGSSVYEDSPGKEYWGGLPCPLPGDLPNPGIEPRSPSMQVDALLSEPLEKLSSPSKHRVFNWY